MFFSFLTFILIFNGQALSSSFLTVPTALVQLQWDAATTSDLCKDTTCNHTLVRIAFVCGSQIPLLAVAIKFVFVHDQSAPVYDISAVHATLQCLVCSICCLSWRVHTMLMIESDLPQEAPMPSRLYKMF